MNFIRLYIILLFVVFLLTACTQANDETELTVRETRFSAMTGVMGSAGISRADAIRNMQVFFVAPSSGQLIKKEYVVVLPEEAEAHVHTVIPAVYAGQSVNAYFIANASALSDTLNVEPGSVLDISRLENLSTRALLNGPNSQFVMSAKISFQADGTDMPFREVRFDRTFAKVYIAPAEGMGPEQQRDLKVLSVEIVNGRTGGYLFRKDVFPEYEASRLFPVNCTIDEMNIDRPVCYLYPDEGGSDGGYLLVKLQNNTHGQVVTKRVLLCPKKNTAYKLTIGVLSGENDGYEIRVSDWEENIQLPDVGQGVLPSPFPDEGIDLLTNPEVFHYYNQLRDTLGKRLYRSIFDKANNFTETLRPGERLIVELPDEFRGKFTVAEFLQVAYSLLNDMAIMFNTGIITGYRQNAAGRVLSYRMDLIAMRPVFDVRVRLVISATREFLDRIPPGLSEFERVKTVRNLFLRNVSYGGMTSSFGGNVIGGLISRKVVCEGYARTLQYLLQRVGIRAIFISGDANFSDGSNIPHAWNIVRIDGKYYAIDATWDDGMAGMDVVAYNYFLKSDATMSKDHTIRMQLPVPACPEDYPLPIFE